MEFLDCLRTAPVILTEGAVIERLRRDRSVPLNPHVLNAALLYDEPDREYLASLYCDYLDIGRRHALPMLIGTPTWRANPERLQAAGLHDRDVNGDAVGFLRTLRASYGTYAARIYLAGLMGCRGDAYRPAEALSAGEAAAFHRPQAEALAAAGVDGLLAATLPAVSEALGLARTLGATGRPYFLSFVVRRDGTCLDGTPLDEALRQIDREAQPPPTAYLVNCVHPTVFAAAVAMVRDRAPDLAARLIGLQANTSALSPEELDERGELDSMSPAKFADGMLAVWRDCGARILGGCCGTDDTHIAHLAARLAGM